jgi:hypothetical protein
MRWFARKQPKDIWDEAVTSPMGDIEAAELIRNICQAATASAELVGDRGAQTGRGKASVEKRRKRERERYERAARTAMQVAMKISDDLMRDDAVRRIVDLCMKADDIETARILYRAIHAVWIREAANRDHPALAQ